MLSYKVVKLIYRILNMAYMTHNKHLKSGTVLYKQKYIYLV